MYVKREKQLCPVSLTFVLVSAPLEQHMESRVHRPAAASASPRSLLEMQTLLPESDTLGLRPRGSVF